MQHFVSLADEFHTFPDEWQNSCEIHVQLHWGVNYRYLPLSVSSLLHEHSIIHLFTIRVLILFSLKLLSHDKHEYLPKPLTHLSM